MEVFYYKDPKLNFGDDLNSVLWRYVLPPAMFDVPDISLVGIGSILSEEFAGTLSTRGNRVIVLGTGTSYDQPPKNVEGWHILAVRGPWTASMLNRPEAAATDGAILLHDADQLHGVADQRDRIIFMPHHRSIRRTRWHEIAAAAGMDYVSPQQPVSTILAAFARAKLVVTEAMHGAIVADALRIPWVPVVISPGIDEFKWRDWSLSLNLPFQPTYIPAAHPTDRLRYKRMAALLASENLDGHQNLSSATSRADLQQYFDRRFSPDMKQRLLATGATRAEQRLLQVKALFDGHARGRTVKALQQAAQQTPFLSAEPIFFQRLDQMREAVRLAARIALGPK